MIEFVIGLLVEVEARAPECLAPTPGASFDATTGMVNTSGWRPTIPAARVDAPTLAVALFTPGDGVDGDAAEHRNASGLQLISSIISPSQ